MRNTRFPGLVALALGASVLAGPAAAQQQPPRPAPAPAPAVSPDEALGLPPANWWFQDLAGGRFPGTAADRAYRELLAGRQPRQPVIVAILDTGVDIRHEDLDGVIWTNEDEIPGNGVDDDRNGYVDDVHGWNFIGGKGGNVHQDTYEITRVYGALRRYEGARQDTLSAAGRAEYQRYQEIKAEFQKEIAETQEQLQQVAGIKTALDQFLRVLRREVGSDSLTVANVTALRPVRMEVMQAQQAYVQLAAAGITPKQVDDEVERLQGRLKNGLNPDFNPRTVVGDDPNDTAQRVYGNNDLKGPDASHGTHVAGIVGAERGNGVGVDGIAPAVRIMPVRVVPDGDERDKDVANAIRYAVDNGARVINMSFGKAYSPQKTAVDEAVRYADSKGVLLVHAAGNDAANLDTQPSYPVRAYQAGGQPKLWIEVGASSYSADSLAASFSNYSRTRVDVFAPGVSILSTVPDNGYQRNQGTSMAAPVVSGLAALIMSYYPQLSTEQVRAIILESATRFPNQRVAKPGEEAGQVAFSELSATGGVVNAYEALRLAAQRAGSR
ncbi:MAG TPA: S8 family serine peptidase [Longimicrobiaceae bacterium]|nr:S8 family serine peptidase [Longimicrobiaceae bacterium]